MHASDSSPMNLPQCRPAAPKWGLQDLIGPSQNIVGRDKPGQAWGGLGPGQSGLWTGAKMASSGQLRPALGPTRQLQRLSRPAQASSGDD